MYKIYKRVLIIFKVILSFDKFLMKYPIEWSRSGQSIADFWRKKNLNFQRFKLDKVVAPSSEFNQLPASEVSTSKKFSAPKELIRYKAKKSDEYESLIEYDCDEEVCNFKN